MNESRAERRADQTHAPVVLPGDLVLVAQQVEVSRLLALPAVLADVEDHQGRLLDPVQHEAGEHSLQRLAPGEGEGDTQGVKDRESPHTRG